MKTKTSNSVVIKLISKDQSLSTWLIFIYLVCFALFSIPVFSHATSPFFLTILFLTIVFSISFIYVKVKDNSLNHIKNVLSERVIQLTYSEGFSGDKINRDFSFEKNDSNLDLKFHDPENQKISLNEAEINGDVHAVIIKRKTQINNVLKYCFVICSAVAAAVIEYMRHYDYWVNHRGIGRHKYFDQEYADNGVSQAFLAFVIFLISAILLVELLQRHFFVRSNLFDKLSKFDSKSVSHDMEISFSFMSKFLVESFTIKEKEYNHPLEKGIHFEKKSEGYNVKLSYLSGKAESYLLESIFLGALAFGGFLTILASYVERGEIHLNEIFDKITSITKQASELKIVGNNVDSILTGEYVVELIALESLLSAIFFLIVIAYRHHLVKSTERIEEKLKKISVQCAKYEELALLDTTSELKDSKAGRFWNSRREKWEGKIEKGLNDIERGFSHLHDNLELISIMRNLGVFFFWSLIITSCSLFSNWLAIFITFFVLILVYGNVIRMYFLKRSLQGKN